MELRIGPGLMLVLRYSLGFCLGLGVWIRVWVRS